MVTRKVQTKKYDIRNRRCRTLQVKKNTDIAIPIRSSHNPISLDLIKLSNEEDIKYHKRIWRMNTYIAQLPEHTTKILHIRDKFWNKCKHRSDSYKTKQYIAMKVAIAKYLKAQQAKESDINKKEKEELLKIIKYDGQHSNDEIEDAKTKLELMDQHKSHYMALRSDTNQINGISKNSKYHFNRARKAQKRDLMNGMLNETGDLVKTQKEIKEVNVKFWSHVGIYQMYTTYKELQDRLANKICPEKPQLRLLFLPSMYCTK